MSTEWTFPASFAQERVWLANQLDTGSPVYTVSLPLRFPAGTTGEHIRAALTEVVRRHDPLRTHLRMDGGTLVQVVRAAQRVEVPTVDLHRLPADEVARRTAELAEAMGGSAIPLEEPPPWRARLVRHPDGTDGQQWSLLFVVHHAMFDAASTVVFTREMAAFARAAREGGTATVPELPIGYPDYAAWQRDRLSGPELGPHLAYWRQLLAGAPPVTCPPPDRPRPSRLDHAGDQITFSFPDGLFGRVTALARSTAATPYTVLLAAFAALLGRTSGGTDVVLGVPTAGRFLPELAPLIGMFVNTLPLRVDVGGDPRFRRLVERVRTRFGEAMNHAEVPFQRIVDEVAPHRDPSVQPLFQVSFNFIPDSGLDPVPGGTTTDDLCVDLIPQGGRLRYRTALFDRCTAEALVRRYLRLLDTAVGDPDLPVSRLPLLTDEERRLVLADWNDTAARPPRPDGTVTRLLDRCATRVPDAVAVERGGTRLTYRELHQRADRLARLLAARGAGPESVLALALPRCPGLVVAVVAALKAGAAYLPVDPDHPAERIAYLFDDARPSLVVTTLETAHLGGPDAILIDPDGSPLGDDEAGGAGEPLPVPRPGNAIYVIYTSGSTGRPKGVVVDHRAAYAYLSWSLENYPGLAGTVLLHSPTSFDLSVTGLLGTLAAGGTIRLAGVDEPEARNGGRPAFVKAVPGHLTLFQGDLAPTVDFVLGGDPLVGQVLARWWREHPEPAITNEYGPTETTVGCTGARLPPGTRVPDGVVPIGRPFTDMNAYVLDATLRPVPPGVVGELYMAGPQVARGYLNSPALTATKFLPCPYGAPGRRMYRTGDLARWRSDGVLEYMGRVDHQVKVDGVRIEPAEVEAALLTHPDVRHAVAVARADGGDTRLVAYVVPRPGREVAPVTLSAHLARILPAPMVPGAVVVLDALPLTPTGKLDRDSLPAPPAPALAAYAEPQGGIEELVAEVYAAVLRVPRVGRRDDFFALGGNSLRGMRAMSRLRQEIDVDVPVRTLFSHPVVADLAAEIERVALSEVDALSDEQVAALLTEEGRRA